MRILKSSLLSALFLSSFVSFGQAELNLKLENHEVAHPCTYLTFGQVDEPVNLDLNDGHHQITLDPGEQYFIHLFHGEILSKCIMICTEDLPIGEEYVMLIKLDCAEPVGHNSGLYAKVQYCDEQEDFIVQHYD